MLTADDILLQLKDYLKTSDGKKVLKDAGISALGYTEAEMNEIAVELRDTIIDAYLSVVKDPEKYYDVKTVRINKPRKQKDGTWKLTVSFTERGLFRRSLYSNNPRGDGGAKLVKTSTGSGWFTGDGVYDIIGLFTMGYTAKASVYGTWWDNKYDDGDRGIETWSRRSRPANDFINRAIKSFKLKYPNLDVTYPKEWGGNA